MLAKKEMFSVRVKGRVDYGGRFGLVMGRKGGGAAEGQRFAECKTILLPGAGSWRKPYRKVVTAGVKSCSEHEHDLKYNTS